MTPWLDAKDTLNFHLIHTYRYPNIYLFRLWGPEYSLKLATFSHGKSCLKLGRSEMSASLLHGWVAHSPLCLVPFLSDCSLICVSDQRRISNGFSFFLSNDKQTGRQTDRLRVLWRNNAAAVLISHHRYSHTPKDLGKFSLIFAYLLFPYSLY